MSSSLAFLYQATTLSTFFLISLDTGYVICNDPFKMKCGKRMGTNCPPFVADLLLFCYESFHDISF